MACGDDGGSPDAATDAPVDVPVDAAITAFDYEGMWLMTSLTIDVQGTPTTLVRDGTPQGLRGDVVLDAESASAASLSVRQAILVNGVLADDPGLFEVTIVLDGDRWLLTNPDEEVVVLAARLTGSHLVLDLVPDDPRLTDPAPPHQIVLDRHDPWSTATVGDWDLISLTNASGTLVAGTCIQAGSGTWVQVTMDIGFDDRLVFERGMTTIAFSDDQCTVETQRRTSIQRGIAEEEGAATLRMWGKEGDVVEHLVFALASSGDQMTLTRTACLPLPDCTSDAPTEVVVRRAPAASGNRRPLDGRSVAR